MEENNKFFWNAYFSHNYYRGFELAWNLCLFMMYNVFNVWVRS